jgi:quercetin dioxygenase-like cupin family protein
VLSGGDGERACAAGDVVVFAPDELHGMRAADAELLLLATIAPRPGARAGARAGTPVEAPTGAPTGPR